MLPKDQWPMSWDFHDNILVGELEVSSYGSIFNPCILHTTKVCGRGVGDDDGIQNPVTDLGGKLTN